jgi:preprotein translocase subunit SecA
MYSVGPIHKEVDRFTQFCEKRKYKQKEQRWFGIILFPEPIRIRYIVRLDYSWLFDSRLDIETKGMKTYNEIESTRQVINKKTGRNEKCPCGSGKKYKHCCGS